MMTEPCQKRTRLTKELLNCFSENIDDEISNEEQVDYIDGDENDEIIMELVEDALEG